MRTVPRIALTLSVALGSLVTAGAVVFRQSAVERRVEDLLAATLSAPAHFAEATFRPGEGLIVRDLVILDPLEPLAPPLVRIETARIDLQFGQPGRLVHVDEIEIDGLHARMQREDGVLRLAALVQTADDQSGNVPPIIVNGGTLAYSDNLVFAPGVAFELELDRATFLPTSEDGDLPVRERRRLEVTGRSPTTGELSVSLGWLSAGRTEITASAASVDLASSVVRGLAGDVGDELRAYQLDGTLALEELSVDVRADAAPRIAALARARDVSGIVLASDARSPLRVTKLEGTLRLADGKLSVPEDRPLRAALPDTGARATVWGTLDGLAGAHDPALDLRAAIRSLRLEEDLHRYLPADAVAFLEEFEITGTCDSDVTLVGDAANPDVTATAQIRAGSFNYRGIPAGPLGELDGFPWRVSVSRGDIRFADRELTFDAAGTRGKTRVVSTGTVRWDDAFENESVIDITGHDVLLDDDLRTAFGSSAAEYWDPFKPSGTVAEVRVRVRRLFEFDPIESIAEYDVVFDGRAAFQPDEFPVPLREAKGELQLRSPMTPNGRTTETLLHQISAVGDGFKVTVDGVLREDGDIERERVLCVAEVDDLSGAFARGLEESSDISEDIKSIARDIRARGKARVELAVDAAGQSVVLDMQGMSTPGWEEMPVALDDLHGVVRIGASDIELDQIRAKALGTSIRADGRLVDVHGAEPGLELELAAPGLHLGRRLREGLGALADAAAAVWTDIAPGDDAKADVVLTLRADGNHTCVAQEVRGSFAPLGLPVTIDGGAFEYRDGLARLSADAELGHATGRLRDLVADVETGAFTCVVDFKGLHFPEDLASLLPEKEIDEILETARERTIHGRDIRITSQADGREVNVEGTLDVRPRSRASAATASFEIEGLLDLNPLRITRDEDGEGARLSGQVDLREIEIDAGVELTDLHGEAVLDGRFGTDDRNTSFALRNTRFQAYDRRVTDASLTLEITEDALRMRKFDGALAGGRLKGWFAAGERGPGSYEGVLRVADARAERFFHATEDERIEGELRGEVRFRNDDGAEESLRGNGRFRLRDGRFLNVPVFARMLQAWKQLPVIPAESSDRFRKLDLHFDLDGRWMNVVDFEMESDALELKQGSGRIGLDGRLDVVLVPSVQAGVPVFDHLVLVFQGLARFATGYQIQVNGTLRNPRANVSSTFLPSGSKPEIEPQPTNELPVRGDDPW